MIYFVTASNKENKRITEKCSVEYILFLKVLLQGICWRMIYPTHYSWQHLPPQNITWIIPLLHYTFQYNTVHYTYSIPHYSLQNLPPQNSTWIIIYCKLWTIFLVQVYHFQIAEVKYQGQTRYTRILDSKPFFNTYCSIQYRFGLKYFPFAQFLLNADLAAHQHQKS